MLTVHRVLVTLTILLFSLIGRAQTIGAIVTDPMPTKTGDPIVIQVYGSSTAISGDFEEMLELIRRTEKELAEQARNDSFILKTHSKPSEFHSDSNTKIEYKKGSILNAATTAVAEIESNKKLYRNLALVRLVTAGGVTAAGLLVMDNPQSLAQSLFVGLVAGGLSGLIQLNYDLFFKVMTTNYFSSAFMDENSNKLLKSIVNSLEYYLKWGATEVVFLLGVRAAMIAVGVPVDPAILLLATAAKGMASQGVYDKATTFRMKEKIKANPSAEAKYLRMLNYQALLGSAVSISMAVADMAGFHISTWGFAALFATGVVIMVDPAQKQIRQSLFYHKMKRKVFGSEFAGSCRFAYL